MTVIGSLTCTIGGKTDEIDHICNAESREVLVVVGGVCKTVVELLLVFACIVVSGYHYPR